MQKKRVKLFVVTVVTMVFFLTATSALAAQPEIIWLESPAENQQVSYYNTDIFSDLPYAPAYYGEGLYSVTIEEGERIYTALSPDGAGTFRTGYVNQQGQWVIPPIYDWGNAFSQGVALVGQSMEEKRNGGTYGWTADRVIDINGTPIAAFDELDQQGYSITQVQNGYVLLFHRASIEEPIYYGIADLSGNLILPVTFFNAHLPQDGLCLAQTKKGYGFWDTTGNVMVQPQYEDAKDFSEGLAAVQQDGKWGFIDRTGEMAIAPVYDEVQSFSEGLAAVKVNGLWGFVNAFGQLTVPAQYEAVQMFSGSVAAVQQNDKWGCIDQNGDCILSCKYEEVRPCNDNRMAVKWQGRYGYFDGSGEKIIDFLYGAATDFHEGLTIASTGDFSNSQWNSYWRIGMRTEVYNHNTFGVIDRWGNSILAEEYLCISDFTDGTAICQRAADYKVGIIQAPSVSEQDPGTRNFIRLYFNDTSLNSEQSPIIQKGRTLVPLRTIAEALGADVLWDDVNQAAIIKTENRVLQLPINEEYAMVDGMQLSLDVPAQIVNGRTMVPLRFIAEQLQAQVQWNNTNRTVTISK